MKNGNWIKWTVATLLPMVLSLGIWVGSVNTKVIANEHEDAKRAEKVDKLVDKVVDIDKKVTAILCAIAPDKCL